MRRPSYATSVASESSCASTEEDVARRPSFRDAELADVRRPDVRMGEADPTFAGLLEALDDMGNIDDETAEDSAAALEKHDDLLAHFSGTPSPLPTSNHRHRSAHCVRLPS